MVTKCYLLGKDEIFPHTLAWLSDRIPCFIDIKTVTPYRFELYIKCRAEDVAFVERTLAPFM